MSDTIKIQLFRSLIGRKPAAIRIATALGFSRLQQVLVKKKSPAVMGMIRKTSFMVKIIP